MWTALVMAASLTFMDQYVAVCLINYLTGQILDVSRSTGILTGLCILRHRLEDMVNFGRC